MSFRSNHNPTVSERIRYLELTEKRLSYRTDLKFDVGCLVTPKELSDVQFRVMAQVYGIQ